MSVVVSQKNRAVSQSAIDAVDTARSFTYKNLFALPGNHNKIDGTYFTFTDGTDSGWWGNALSSNDGTLPSAAVLTISERTSAYTFTIVGINGNYPVDFTLSVYRDNVPLKTVTVTNNTQETAEVTLDKAYDVDTTVLSITKISKANDVLKIATASFDVNVSNLMKLPSRHIHGRVEVVYANAVRDTAITTNEGAHGSNGSSLSDDSYTTMAMPFKLYDNKLDGTYHVIGANSKVGWWAKTMPDGTGSYSTPQTLHVAFSQRNLYGLSIHCDATNYLVDFTITVTDVNNDTETIAIVDNDSAVYSNDTVFNDAVSVDITISKCSQASTPAIIIEVPVTASLTYNDEDLIDIGLLEELSFEDSIEKLGGISSNELTVNFRNDDGQFYFNNASSPIAAYLKKHRRVRAWLGIELPDGSDTLWSVLGTFWSYNWDVPVGSLIAKVVAFDTLSLLSTMTYYDHQVYRNKSIGELVDIVLGSAKESLSFLTWSVDAALYNTYIPIAWFNYDSYTAALNRIASCDTLNIYCARDGSIVASQRLNGVQSPDDVWSDDTNIISKTYPTLYTDIPNSIDVAVSRITVSSDEVLSISDVSYSVVSGDTLRFNFSAPVESTSSVSISSTASYTHEVYSWGIIINFTSSGSLTAVTVMGQALAVDKPISVHLQDDNAIAENGAIKCEVVSDFIQSSAQATSIAQYLYDKLTESVYDVEVSYRGDIALTLNNKISLPEGIAPDNLYFIKRHELFWNGTLNGTARLNT